MTTGFAAALRRGPARFALAGALTAVPCLTAVGSTFTPFGTNKVQYRRMDWHYLTTEHFDVYYYQDGRGIADFAAEVAEEAYRSLARRFNYTSAGREPIVILTYRSHNDFNQTNATTEEPDEATGGFTEFLKTRVVVPYEGDYEKFRHVIHHELTHAVMLNALYGQGLASIVSGISQTRMPQWFTEGLSEYESHGGLDRETEMILRDAVLNDILPEISQLDHHGYLGVYKCGQSVIYWIAWRYGDEKVTEILMQTKGFFDFERAVKASLGMDMDELSKRWRQFLKERYWPQVVNLDSPERIATRLTNHRKEYCYVNNSPALSPDGEWLALLSDRSDYFDIYLMSTVDTKVKRRLVRGQRSGRLEELHWLRPGITWSPDAGHIAFCAKAGDQDALTIVNVETGKVQRQIKLGADGLFSPAWSPDGDRIALVMIKNGRSDVIVYNLPDDKWEPVTADLWDDADPSWSTDSRSLLFTSNRGDAGLDGDLPPGNTLYGKPFSQFDIYRVDLAERHLTRVTADTFTERTPVWTSNPDEILYVSDYNGTYNLYRHILSTGQTLPLTNVSTGIFQPTLAARNGALAFTAYCDFGYDIFLVSDLQQWSSKTEITILPPAEKVTARGGEGSPSISSVSYEHFVFDRLINKPETAPTDTSALHNRARQEGGQYPSRKYRVELTPDEILVNASYSPYYQAQGYGLLMLTDVLGNHQLFVSLYLNRYLEYSNTYLRYNYLARRLNYGAGFYHYANPFYDYAVDWVDRNWGVFLFTSYPLNRYNRIEFGGEYRAVERSVWREIYPGYAQGRRIDSVIPHLGFVHDVSVWRVSTAPTNGGRWRVDLSASSDMDGDAKGSYDFVTAEIDWRKYLRYRRDYTFAFRLAGSASSGPKPQRFFLGGVENWLNRRFDNESSRPQVDINDVYFSTFAVPLRGVGYYNQVGNRYILTNFEFRFPFIKHLVFGWPLPIYIQNLQGALFSDLGTAWMTGTLDRRLLPSKWAHGYGMGIRLDLGIAPVEWDVAWSRDSGYRPQYLFSLNLGF